MVQDLNGSDWPNLDFTVDLPQPKPFYTPQELAQNYATLAVHHGQLWQRVVHALEYLRGHLIGTKSEVAATAKEVKLLREALQGQIASSKLGLPPMRLEAPSTVSAVESIKTKISGEFEKIAKESQGPYVEADPRRLMQVVEKTITEELARRDAAKQALEQAAKLKAFEDAAHARKKFLQKAVGAFLVAVATAAGTWAWGKTQGHIEGKQAAYDEVRKGYAMAPQSYAATAVTAVATTSASAVAPMPAAAAPAAPAKK